MNWQRYTYDYSGWGALVLLALIWVASLIGLGVAAKLSWRIFMLGWGLV